MNLPHRATSVVVAIWRRDGEQVEFWVPLGGYLNTLGFSASRVSPAEAARRQLINHFGLNPRCNARALWHDHGCVVAFTLTETEITQMQNHGAWLPTSLIDPMVGHLLQDIVPRL